MRKQSKSQTERPSRAAGRTPAGAPSIARAIGSFPNAPGDARLRFREQLGLPTSKPIIMTGHQPQFWHPGILAKYVAADAAAEAQGAEVAWLWVDHDEGDPFIVRYPARERDGRLVVRTLDLLAAMEKGDDAGGQAVGADAAATFVRDGLRRIVQACRRVAEQSGPPVAVAPAAHGAGASFGDDSLPPLLQRARFVAAAVGELVRPWLRRPPAAEVFASTLGRTDLFRELVQRMAADPESCCAAYNAAVGDHPSAGMRPLLANTVQDRFELPLWRLDESGERHRVYAEDLAMLLTKEPIAQAIEDASPEKGPIAHGIEDQNEPRLAPASVEPTAHGNDFDRWRDRLVSTLIPRALLLTGLVRMAGCDLFIHGTGGGGAASDGDGEGETSAAAREGYDRITEQWLHTWLALPPQSLAPIAVATANRYLPLETDPLPTPAEIARAFWLAHHARHDPAMLGDDPAAAKKAALVEAIARSPRRTRQRETRFDQLQHLLDDYRERHRPRLLALRKQAFRTRDRLGEAAILADRTWAFALYPDAMMHELRDQFSRPERSKP